MWIIYAADYSGSNAPLPVESHRLSLRAHALTPINSDALHWRNACTTITVRAYEGYMQALKSNIMPRATSLVLSALLAFPAFAVAQDPRRRLPRRQAIIRSPRQQRLPAVAGSASAINPRRRRPAPIIRRSSLYRRPRRPPVIRTLTPSLAMVNLPMASNRIKDRRKVIRRSNQIRFRRRVIRNKVIRHNNRTINSSRTIRRYQPLLTCLPACILPCASIKCCLPIETSRGMRSQPVS